MTRSDDSGQATELTEPDGTSGAASTSGSDGGDEELQVVEMTGYLPGWFGTRPREIAGDVNPTLELQAGRRYELRWTNGDGLSHSFIVRDENGEWIAGTPLSFGSGTTRSVQFTATEAMSSYHCTVHPRQMRGEIRVEGQTDASPDTDLPEDISPVTERSTVTFREQAIEDGAVTIESTTVPEGGFVAIHTPRFKRRPRTVRDIKLSVVGWSEYLEPGTHQNVRVEVEPVAGEAAELIAMNHRDTNNTETYDFVTDGPAFADADWPYFTPRGKAVTDTAPIADSGGEQG